MDEQCQSAYCIKIMYIYNEIATCLYSDPLINVLQISCQFLCLCAEKCERLYDGLVQCNFHK